MSDLQCNEVRHVLPELAAGVASGEMRAAALAHLAGCAACRRELDDIAGTIDDLLLLAPEREPPAGFDLRVLNSLNDQARRPRQWVRNAFILAAAVVLVAAAGIGFAWVGGDDNGGLSDGDQETLASVDGTVRTADIRADGRTYGNVFLYDGDPSWLFLTMEAPGSGSYPVRLVTTDGATTVLGTCTLRDGSGHWGTILDVPVSSVDQIQLVREGYPTMTAEIS